MNVGICDQFIKSVRPLSDYRIEVVMQTGTVVNFDFTSRLHTLRFAALQEDAVFHSVRTDGDYLLFKRGEVDCVRVTARELMDMCMSKRAI
ncbi:MAG: DUF2442 domain-containing protein [Clostridiales bacterium]|nr:DUF2442 domain-containing protein [Clostridiales bacterium]